MTVILTLSSVIFNITGSQPGGRDPHKGAQDDKDNRR